MNNQPDVLLSGLFLYYKANFSALRTDKCDHRARGLGLVA